MKANLVLKNASVYTVDKERSWAQAIAIADDKIVFVGSNADVESYIESRYSCHRPGWKNGAACICG